MATDQKISGMSDATSLNGAESVEVVQGGINKKTTTQDIANLANPATTPDLPTVLTNGNDASGQSIVGLPSPSIGSEATNKDYVDAQVATVGTPALASVVAQGNTTSGTIITGLPTPTTNSDAANKQYVDGVASGSSHLADFTTVADAAPLAANCNSLKEPKFYTEIANNRTIDFTNVRAVSNANQYVVVLWIFKKTVAGDIVITLDADSSQFTNKDLAADTAATAYTLTGASNSYFKLTAVFRGESSGSIVWWNLVTTSAGGGGGTWGSITGTLSSQADLQGALDAKLALAGGTMSGAIAMGSSKITGLAAGTTNGDAVAFQQLPGTATSSTAGLVKLYTATGSGTDGTMDQNSITTAISGISGGTGPAKVLLATTANVTLSGEQTIDGVLTSNSRVLVWQQSSGPQNGIYVTNSGSWTRATDFDSTSELNGAFVQVMQGTRYANKAFSIQTYNPTVGTTSLVFYPVQIYDRSTVASTPILNHAFITEAYSGFRPATAGPPRIYIVPNGTPSGTRSKFEMFFTDYFTGSSDYAGFNIFGSDSPNEWHIGANVGGSGPTVNQYYGFYVGSALQTSKAYREMLNSTNVINDFAPGGHVLKHFKNEISTKTGAATLALTDWNKVLDFNSASDANITVPLNSSVAFPVGVVIPWVQRGAGKLTFVQGSGSVTIISLGSLYQSAGQGACGVIRQIIADTWIVAGQLI